MKHDTNERKRQHLSFLKGKRSLSRNDSILKRHELRENDYINTDNKNVNDQGDSYKEKQNKTIKKTTLSNTTLES